MRALSFQIIALSNVVFIYRFALVSQKRCLEELSFSRPVNEMSGTVCSTRAWATGGVVRLLGVGVVPGLIQRKCMFSIQRAELFQFKFFNDKEFRF